ncbi:MAG: cell wall-binding repeat-containing protein [Coriobacteriia bacterium]|nr:cell wall-binding repeat-containing protein [Coriobacteriia bacterium]
MRYSRGATGRLLRVVLAFVLVLPAMGIAPAVAQDRTFVGGPIADDMPLYVPNDHTPQAIRFTAEGLTPDTTYEVKIRISPEPVPAGSENRGFTWNPDTDQWSRNRGPAWGAGNFPTETTDEFGNIERSEWHFFKFGNELNSGPYYIIITLNATGEGGALNALDPPLVTVLDMSEDGTRVHPGVTYTGAADIRRLVASPEGSESNRDTIWGLTFTEANDVDDNADGIVDNESWGPITAGDFQVAVPTTSTVDVWVQQNKRFAAHPLGGADESIALGSVDTTAPTAPADLVAEASPTSVSLEWTASTDNVGVDHYRVYRWQDVNSVEWTPPKTLIGTTVDASFEDTMTVGGATYNYEVRAADAATNVSARSDTAEATVLNVPPVAEDDAYETTRDTALTVLAPGVLANDTDANEDVLNTFLVSDVSNGTLDLSADGGFTYTPDPGFVGTDHFVYRAQDLLSESADALVTITVSVPTFTGGPITEDTPLYVASDHTPQALRFEAFGLEAETDYEIKIGFLPSAASSGSDLGGFTWNRDADGWSFNRSSEWGAGNFPVVTTNAAGEITPSALSPDDWFFFKFGNELESGQYRLMVAVSADGEDGVIVSAEQPLVTVLDMQAEGTWVHPGVASATTAQDERRVVLSPAGSTGNRETIWGISRTENNLVDDDADGIVDNEGERYGPLSDGVGHYRLVAPAGESIDIWVQQNKRVTAHQLRAGGADESIALGSTDTTAPTAPTDVVGEVVATSVSLEWTASTDNVGVDHYRVYRWEETGSLKWTAPKLLVGTSADTSFTDMTAALDVAYNYEVRAVDAATNVSARSETVLVTPFNVPPVAADDEYTTEFETELVVSAPGVLASDTDADNDPLAAELVSGPAPASGALVLNPDGSFTFTPAFGYLGTASFIYRAFDGTDFSAPATVSIDVVDTTPPAQPTVTLERDGWGRVIVNWTGVSDSGSGVASYRVYSGTDAPVSGVLLASARSFTASNLPPGVTASLKVRATDHAGNYRDSDLKSTAPHIALAGATRYETAIKTARQAFKPGEVSAVILTTAQDFPDALAAAPLAGVLDIPILLVPKNLSTDGRKAGLAATLAYAKDELKAPKAIVLGGELAIDAAVRAEIIKKFGTANVDQKLAGANRYVTANLIIDRTRAEMSKAGTPMGNTAFLATGQNFPDALAAAPIAASNGWPVYLTNRTGFTKATHDAMKKAGVNKVVVLGGDLAISAAAYNQVRTAFGSANVTRVWGDTRYDTAVKIANLAVDGSIPETSRIGVQVTTKHSWDRVGLTRGDLAYDALAGSMLQAKPFGTRGRSVTLLTNRTKLSVATEAVLKTQKAKDSIDVVTFYGGADALSQDVRTSVLGVVK